LGRVEPLGGERDVQAPAHLAVSCQSGGGGREEEERDESERPDGSARDVSAHQKIAIGCAGAPVAPTRRSGVAVNRNSLRPSSAHAFARRSGSELSMRARPRNGIARWVDMPKPG